jgi:hypothetical protein
MPFGLDSEVSLKTCILCEALRPGEKPYEADRVITTGPFGGEMQTLPTCGECSHRLWEGDYPGCIQPLKNLVTACINYFLIEPLDNR